MEFSPKFRALSLPRPAWTDSLAGWAWIWPALALLSFLPFAPFLGLPLISDDYSQLYFARLYFSSGGLDGLLGDVLYRSRATSLLLTRGIDAVFGASQPAHLVAGLLLHGVNSWLVYRLAFALRLERPAALLAGACFATYSGHQEAIVWIASQHELFVFAFTATAAICWLRRLAGGGVLWALAAAASCIAALYSKESAVVVIPLLLALWWTAPGPSRRADLLWLLPVACLALAYTLAIFQSSGTHLHLNDGTFSLRAPFWKTLPISWLRLLWPAGFVALAIITRLGDEKARRLAAGAGLWMAVALLPYSFLTYQARVPSRHTYLAAAALALLVASSLHTLVSRFPFRGWYVAAGLFLLFLGGNLSNLWLRKLPQFERRAQATERFISFSRLHPGPIAIGNAPFPLTVYQHAVAVRFGRPPGAVRRADSPLDPHESLYEDEVHP